MWLAPVTPFVIPTVCLFTVGGAKQHFFTNQVAVFKFSLDTTFDLSLCPPDISKKITIWAMFEHNKLR